MFLREGDDVIVISIYVDDLLLFSNNESKKVWLKNQLSERFAMKYLGEARNILGVRITQDKKNKKVYLDQEDYIEMVLNKFGMKDCNPAKTPLELGSKLSK
jgi:Reverse transcriptase (RNA-dependent DNA polymerase)